MQPLSTPEAVVTGMCPEEVRSVRLFGFQEQDPRLAQRLEGLFSRAATVTHAPLDAYFEVETGSADLEVALLDTYRQVKSNATARRLTNMYFTFTVIDIWILPILHSTNLFGSSAELSAEIGIRMPADSGTERRKISPRTRLFEKPTGYFGPDDEEFTRAMVDRATANLAVNLYEQTCGVVRNEKRRKE